MAQNWNPPPGGQPPGGPPPGGYGGPPPGGYGAPPPGGYGGPPPQGGYGVQPGFGPPMGPITMPTTEGSVALGFCAGFFGGCIGLGLVYAIAKGPQTKRGALIGFGCQFAVGILFRIIAAANH